MAEKVMGIARRAPLPHFSTRGTFGDWWAQHQPRQLHADKKVAYFHGCSTMYYEPFVGQATVAVLEHNGYEVVVPRQNCCGLPMLSNGEFDAAASYHFNNVRNMQVYAEAGLAIVGTSTSCTLTMKEEAPELLDAEDIGTHKLKMATWDLFEWLQERHDAGELKTDFQELKLVLPYHAPCQFRAHRVGKPALAILALIPGVEVRESRARCCGIAGTYGYKVEKYDIAMAVGAELFDFVHEQGADVRLTACDSETCRWQLEHGTGLPSRHPVEILAAAYGLYDLEQRKPSESSLAKPSF
jgi:glycerol-3-phosphate dehydrogenase subunit C